jgi:hypothetical protein
MPAIESASTQLAGFIDKFEPAMAKRIRACRTALRKRFPGANEKVPLGDGKGQLIIKSVSAKQRPRRKA